MVLIKNNEKKDLHPMLNLMNLLVDLQKCVKDKCEIERKKVENSADIKTINNLRKDLENNKITVDKYLEQFSEVKLNILKSDIRNELIKCQLNNCYSFTKKTIDNSVSNILNSKIYSKNEPVYKLAKKLLKYKDKKLTLKDLKDIDVASHLKMYGQYIKK